MPCISFDCPSGPRDIIKNEYNGYLVSCYDKKEFADKIIAYINLSSEEKKKLSINANKTIDKWDNEKIINSWIEIFNKIEKYK